MIVCGGGCECEEIENKASIDQQTTQRMAPTEGAHQYSFLVSLRHRVVELNKHRDEPCDEGHFGLKASHTKTGVRHEPSVSGTRRCGGTVRHCSVSVRRYFGASRSLPTKELCFGVKNPLLLSLLPFFFPFFFLPSLPFLFFLHFFFLSLLFQVRHSL